MEIRGPNKVPPVRPVERTGASRSDGVSSVEGGPLSDQLEISTVARLQSLLAQVPEIRHERVLEVRGQIERGEYESAEKLEQALELIIQQGDLA